MVSDDDDDDVVDISFDDVPLAYYDIWWVNKFVTVTTDGVDTDIVLYLACSQHEGKIGIVVPPQMALLLAADLVREAADA